MTNDSNRGGQVIVTLTAEDAETALFCVLSGRARLRELGDTFNDEGPVDNLAVAARMLWEALPEDWRLEAIGANASREARGEFAHVLSMRLDENLNMVEDKTRLEPHAYEVIAAWSRAHHGRRVHFAYDSEGGCFNASHEGELAVTFPGPGRVALTLIAGPRDLAETTTRHYPATAESDGYWYEAEVEGDTLYVNGPEGAGAYSTGSQPEAPRADGMPF
jgi:hypothetical protein